jgi:hypothetical protein
MHKWRRGTLPRAACEVDRLRALADIDAEAAVMVVMMVMVEIRPGQNAVKTMVMVMMMMMMMMVEILRQFHRLLLGLPAGKPRVIGLECA